MNDFSPAVIALSKKAGFEMLRRGKGDHSIWWRPADKRRTVVDATIKSRHTANAVLKQASLPKAF